MPCCVEFLIVVRFCLHNSDFSFLHEITQIRVYTCEDMRKYVENFRQNETSETAEDRTVALQQALLVPPRLTVKSRPTNARHPTTYRNPTSRSAFYSKGRHLT